VFLGGRIEVVAGSLIVQLPEDDGRVSGSISASGGFIKQGRGTLTITTASIDTFGGISHVEEGGLIVNGLLSGDVVVLGGAFLSGTGQVRGIVDVTEGGTLTPGPGIGTLHVDELILRSGARLEMDVRGVQPGVQYDQIIVHDDIQVDGGVLVVRGGSFAAPKGTAIVLIVNAGPNSAAGLLVG
jgi:fibronectin-binding autotransporter adhesin